MLNRFALLGAVLLALLVLLPGFATSAEDPYRPPSPEDVDRRGFTPADADAPGALRDPEAGSAWREFTRRRPGWVARWDARRGAPERLFGAPIPLGAVPVDRATVDGAARRFLDAEAGAWLDADNLALVQAQRDGGGWWVQYAQTHDGVRVVGGRAYVRTSLDGRVPLFGADTWPEVRPGEDPRLELPAVFARAMQGAGDPADLELARHELVLLPVERDGTVIHRYAYEVDFHATARPGAWRSYVDAADGSLLWRYSTLLHGDVNGTARGAIEPLRPGDPQVDRVFPHMLMTLEDTTGAAYDTTVTDASGAYALTGPGGDRLVRATLSGPYGYIRNMTFGNETPVADFPVNPDLTTFFPVGLDDGNTRIQDRNAYYWVMVSRTYIKSIQPDFDLLDYPMPIVTDIANQECNAFWNGTGVNFYPQGVNCANTARISSVVIHEYGHGITDFQYRPFTPSGAMHEGFSDYFSASYLNDPVIGRGFFNNPNSSIRRIDVDRVWPDDATGQVHNDGLIIAGALWDVREVLGQDLADSLFHYARYGFSDNFDDYFLDLLLVDDDNGNIYDGTPHFDAIVEAFQRHGIGDYSVRVAHQPLPDTESEVKTFPLTASFLSIFPVAEPSLQVHLRIVRGDSTSEETRGLVATGGVREYSALLEAQPAGTRVEYWFTGSDLRGTSATWPVAGGDDPFVFLVGTDDEPPLVEHDPLGDQPVDRDSIRLRARVTDNLDLPIPEVRAAYEVDDGGESPLVLADLGEHRYATTLPVDAAGLGAVVEYRLEVDDAASVPNRTAAPDTGSYAFRIVPGFGRDFESSDGGLTTGTSWEWGETPLFAGSSGDSMWGTDLDGVYPADGDELLYLPAVDMSAWTRAGLFFQHRYSIEPFWDGAVVEARAGAGSWQVLTPDGGYPFAFIASTGGPGYSGDLDDWTEARFDLTQFLGAPTVNIRLRLRSDSGLEAFGWYVDDLQVLERQVLARPLALRVSSGRDGLVPLWWQAPAGLDPQLPGSTFLGYEVHRSGDGGASWETLTPAPIADTGWVDGTAANGVAYLYRVTSAFEDGSSPPTPMVEGRAFRSAYLADLGDINGSTEAGETTDVALTLTNEGTGSLRVLAWTAEDGVPASTVRIRYGLPDVTPSAPALRDLGAVPGTAVKGVVPSPARGLEGLGNALAERAGRGRLLAEDHAATPPTGSWETLFNDGADQPRPAVPDIAQFQAQVDDGSLYFRFTSFKLWGDATGGFSFGIALETDMVPDENEIGDYLLLAGAAALNLYNTSVVILDGNLNPVAVPHHVVFPQAGNQAEFGFRLETIGLPREVHVVAAIFDPPANVVWDQVPEDIDVAWLQPQPEALQLEAGESGVFTVQLGEPGLAEGMYTAQLILDTNDPDEPVVTLPVALEVGEQTPVRLLTLGAEAHDLGVRLRWTTTDELDHAGFHVYRSEGLAGPEVRLTTSPLASEGGTYAFEDEEVVDGRGYRYRVADVSRTGSLTFHGPVEVRYQGVAGLAGPVLRQNLPNPFRGSTRVRFGLDRDAPVTVRVYSMQGRLVRSLAEAERYPRGFHELEWDGRDGHGQMVAAGVYTVHLQSPGEVLRRKMVLLR